MSFTEIIENRIGQLFNEHNFEVSKIGRNNIVYQFENFIISFVYDERENSKLIWVGQKGGILVELNNDVSEQVFQLGIKLCNISDEDYFKNVYLFFSNNKVQLLDGNILQYKKLESYNKLSSERYTKNLLLKQTLIEVDRAWKNKEYKKVVALLTKKNIGKVSKVYRKKFMIANKHITSSSLSSDCPTNKE